MALGQLTLCKENRREKKTRSFSVELLAHITLGNQIRREVLQPAFLAYAASEQESRAFSANFRTGKIAKTRNHGSFKLPKKVPYRWQLQQQGEVTITVAYRPDLLHLDPTERADDGHLRFLFAPSRKWLDQQEQRLKTEMGDEARELARAALFAAFIDRRTPLPILDHHRFQLRLLRAAEEAPWMHETSSYRWNTHAFLAEGHRLLGLEEPRFISASNQQLRELITEQTALFFEQEIHHGSTCLTADRRILPHAFETATQLCFDFDHAP